MKKLLLLVIGIFSLFFVPTMVNAASGTISVSSSNTVMVGNNVTVTVTLSSGTPMISWEMQLNYDKNYLKLTSATSEAGGVKMANSSSNGVKSKSYTFTFKTLKTGSTKVSIDSYMAIAFSDLSELSLTPSSKTISIKTKEEIEASYSSNAYLKSLTVGNYDLEPAFKKDTLEYNVEVENDIESITLNATRDDGNATVSGTGEKELVEGNNKFEIVVTAQKGNSLTYVINVYRKELDPIDVSINGENLNIVRRADTLPEYSTFIPTTVIFDGNEIPALYSEITGITLVGLKDDEGNVYTYIYENNSITNVYIELSNNTSSISPLELNENELFKNYSIKEININGAKVNAYVLDETSKYAIIYAQNVETGDINYYSYYMTEGSFQVYNKELINFYENRFTNYKYMLIGSVAIILLLLLILIMRKPSKKVKLNKMQAEALVKTIENHIDNEIKDEVKEEKKEEVENPQQAEEPIQEEKPSKKQKRKKEKIRNDFDF